MCGIYGTTLRHSREVVEKKLELMKFRGPDHQAFKTYDCGMDGKVTLGHVRLSIIDLDARSNQPFDYSDDISIVFNGEIYNYRELKSRFFSDRAFKTTSDTEVICAMYEKFGVDCVKYFNGMFAYVIFDRKRNIFVGARDRLGKKPFYYWHTSKGFEFASQIKVIQYGNDFHIDELARKLYLLHGTYPDPYTPFTEVKKLRAGQNLIYHIDTNRLEISHYWNIFSNSSGFTAPKSFGEAKEVVRDLLFDAVRLRLNADVPVGIFLSGGIDSSLVSAIVAKLNKDICAYTIGFDNAEQDESQHAVAVAKTIGMPIKVSMCVGAEQQRILDDYVDYFDEPFADNSLVPTCLVAQKARENVTVVLGGDGGDELFYGYPKYEYNRLLSKQYERPYWLRKLLSPYFYYRGGRRNMVYSTQRDISDVFCSEGLFCVDLLGTEKFNRIEVGKLLPDRDVIRKDRGVLSYSDYDIKSFMNAVNLKCDRATMRSSLELRNPIMDYRIAEYSRLLPYEYFYDKDLGLKRILKSILYDMVPREVLDRPKKGFTCSTADLFRGTLNKRLLDLVPFESIVNFLPELDANKCITLRDAFIAGQNINANVLWQIYTYINWYRHANANSICRN